MRPSYEVEDSLLRRICRLLVEIVTVIAFAWFIVYSFGTQVVNNGQSMRPTLEDGDRLLLDRFGFKLFGPKRFDIVLFKSDSGQTNIKRIVALPGENVVIRDGKLYVNEKRLETPAYLQFGEVTSPGRVAESISLGRDEYFVLSDNLESGEDSRSESIGNVTRKMIRGRIWFRMQPLRSLGYIR
ncbi:signal peptidase I [Stomatobaculum longum]|uniref:signal peptidase I n=1 Tax=Stomatobaculum longum TaxID=796942 RepID=UPI0028F0C2AC|nr:signal peptidase I [Stomatobaculum longum]